MKLFLDSSDPGEVQTCFERKWAEGVTTGLSPDDRALGELCANASGPVSVAPRSSDRDGMLREAAALARLGARVVVRLPLNVDGLKTARACADQGIGTHLVGCDSAAQAILAAKAGARFVSPVVEAPAGSAGAGGNQLVRDVTAALRSYRLSTEVLVMSVRSPSHLVDVALAGAAVAAVPMAVLQQVIRSAPPASGSSPA